MRVHMHGRRHGQSASRGRLNAAPAATTAAGHCTRGCAIRGFANTRVGAHDRVWPACSAPSVTQQRLPSQQRPRAPLCTGCRGAPRPPWALWGAYWAYCTSHTPTSGGCFCSQPAMHRIGSGIAGTLHLSRTASSEVHCHAVRRANTSCYCAPVFRCSYL